MSLHNSADAESAIDELCARLTSLEMAPTRCTLDSTLDTCLRPYEEVLSTARPMSGPDRYSSPFMACRLRRLGEDLCDTTRAFESGINWTTYEETLSSMYRLGNEELRRHETTQQDCEAFAQFHRRGWRPAVWSWVHNTGSRASAAGLVKHHLQQGHWNHSSFPFVLARSFGSADLPLRAVGSNGARYEDEDIRIASHVTVLERSTGLRLSELAAVVEFGGGTGRLPHALCALGFRGAHVVFDLPWMLTMQRYWHRAASGEGAPPAYLMSHDILLPARSSSAVPSTGALDGRIGLVSSLHWPPLLPPTLNAIGANGLDAKRSLFVATWSLSEAPPSARALVLPHVRHFGRMLIAFRKKFADDVSTLDGVKRHTSKRKGKSGVSFNNTEFMQRWIEGELGATHSTCVWRIPFHSDLYLVAVRRDVGVARCLPDLGCNKNTRATFGECPCKEAVHRRPPRARPA